MQAFGTPEKQILIEPVFAQWMYENKNSDNNNKILFVCLFVLDLLK